VLTTNITKMYEIVNQLQQLNQKQLNQLVNNLPSIEVDLDWDYDCGNDYGKYENDSHEIEFDNYFVRCELAVYETGTTTSATYYTPAEYNTQDKTVEVGHIEVWHNEDEIQLTTEQEEKLRENIIVSVI